MKKFIILLIAILVSFNAYPKGGKKISRPVTGSISIEDEEAHKQRLVLEVENDSYSYANTEYLAPLITYTVDGWSAGLTSQNIPWSGGGAQNYQNDTYLNLSKTIHYEDVSATLGSQTGLVLPMSNSNQPGVVNHNTLHQFYFEDTDIEIWHNRFSIHAGPYYVNQALSTTTSYFGFQDGVEAIIIPKKLRFNFDLYSGHSNVSGRVYELTYVQHKELEYFFGYGEPASNAGNHPYGILGFRLIGIFGK